MTPKKIKENKNSGSPEIDEPEFLAVGKLRRPHGIHGEILMSVWTDDTDLFQPGSEVYIGDSHRSVHIKNVRSHKNGLLISFEEILIREDVGLFRNEILMIRSEQLPTLDDDEFYLHQIIGMSVLVKDTESSLGSITEILKTGANDVYVVHNSEGKEYLIPAIEDVILDIDFEGNIIWVQLLPGLLPNFSI